MDCLRFEIVPLEWVKASGKILCEGQNTCAKNWKTPLQRAARGVSLSEQKANRKSTIARGRRAGLPLGREGARERIDGGAAG